MSSGETFANKKAILELKEGSFIYRDLYAFWGLPRRSYLNVSTCFFISREFVRECFPARSVNGLVSDLDTRNNFVGGKK